MGLVSLSWITWWKYFVSCPKQGLEIEAVVLHRVRISNPPRQKAKTWVKYPPTPSVMKGYPRFRRKTSLTRCHLFFGEFRLGWQPSLGPDTLRKNPRLIDSVDRLYMISNTTKSTFWAVSFALNCKCVFELWQGIFTNVLKLAVIINIWIRKWSPTLTWNGKPLFKSSSFNFPLLIPVQETSSENEACVIWKLTNNL